MKNQLTTQQSLLFLFVFAFSFSMVGQIKTKGKIRRIGPSFTETLNVLQNDNNIKHGPYQYYYGKSQLIKGNYHFNKKHGRWEKFYSDGSHHIKASYIMDKPHGNWVYYYPNGTILAKIKFIEGVKNGIWQGFYESGSTASLIKFDNDELVEFRYYFDLSDERGEPILAQKSIIQEIIKDPVYFFDNVVIKDPSIATDTVYGFDTIHYEELYYNNGVLYKSTLYVNDQIDSIQSIYHKSGLEWQVLEYDKDKLLKVLLYKTRIGTEQVRGSFSNGSGLLKTYDFDGHLKATLNYNNGLKDGKATYVNKGMNWADGTFLNGIRSGNWTYYDPNHNSKHPSVEYEFVSANETKISYSLGINSGRWEGQFLNGRKEGLWKLFNAYGERIAEHNYSLGYKHGLCEIRRSGGALKTKGNYNFGLRTGTWGYFNNQNKFVALETYDPYHLNVTLNEAYIKSIPDLGDKYEKKYYGDNFERYPLGFEYWEGVYFNEKNLLYSNYQVPNIFDARRVLPAPDERTEYNFIPAIFPCDYGFYDDPIDFSNSIELHWNMGLENLSDSVPNNPGIYIVRFNLDYFGAVKECEFVRSLNLEKEKDLIGFVKAIKFFNPPMYNIIPSQGDQVFKIGILKR